MIRVEIPSGPVEVGATLKGQVTWTPDGDAKPRGLRVTLGWRTEGKGNKKEGTCDETERTDIAPGSTVTLPFEFHVPIDGPVSYDGKLMRIIWEVMARVDLPFTRDEMEKREIRVVPGLYRPENHPDDDDDFQGMDDEDEEPEPP